MIQIYILPKFSLSGIRIQIYYLSRKRGKNFPLVFLSINHQASLVSYVWNSTYFIRARRILAWTNGRRVRVKLYFHSCVTPLTKGRGNALRAIVIRNEAMSCNVWMESWKEQDARGECKSIELPAIRRAHARPLISWFSFHVEITD